MIALPPSPEAPGFVFAELIDPGCTGKLAFDCRESAARSVKRVRPGERRGRGAVHPYRCRRCKAWHIGSASL